MKNNYIIIDGNPKKGSYSYALAMSFSEGLQEVGYTLQGIYRLYDDEGNDLPLDAKAFQEVINKADSIVMAFPWMFEMPPAAVVNFLQKVFVKGYAFTHDETGKKVSLIHNLGVCSIITAGQNKELETQYLIDAFDYCGISSATIGFTGIGPMLTPEDAKFYLEEVKKIAKTKQAEA